MHHKTSKGLVRKMMHFVAVPIALIALFLFLVRMVENKLVFFLQPTLKVFGSRNNMPCSLPTLFLKLPTV